VGRVFGNALETGYSAFIRAMPNNPMISPGATLHGVPETGRGIVGPMPPRSCGIDKIKIECGNCGLKFYYHAHTGKITSAGTRLVYCCCYHHGAYNNGQTCGQRPKVIHTHEMNEIFKNFYFYYSLIFDNELNALRDGQEKIKHKITILKEKK
jgi:hypothetical protein